MLDSTVDRLPNVGFVAVGISHCRRRQSMLVKLAPLLPNDLVAYFSALVKKPLVTFTSDSNALGGYIPSLIPVGRWEPPFSFLQARCTSDGNEHALQQSYLDCSNTSSCDIIAKATMLCND